MTKIVRLLLPFYQSKFLEAGIDEAGRGCFAGPVFAAAVILPKDFYHPLLNDSKQLTKEQRNLLRPVIERESIAWAVADVSNREIDRINILQASIKAMHKAVSKLKPEPGFLLIDGNRFKSYENFPFQCIVKGDATYASIAAASVLAKTYRDELMCRLDNKYSMYGWKRNMGYGTLEHRNAMVKYGYSPFHRKSFKMQLSLEFKNKNTENT